MKIPEISLFLNILFMGVITIIGSALVLGGVVIEYLIIEAVLRVEVGDLLDDLSNGLSSLSGKIRPLLFVLVLSLRNSLLPHDCGVDESSGHVEEVILGVAPDFVGVASFVPAVNIHIVEDLID